MSTEIILIGPPGAGKSTLGWLLSEKLGIPQIPLDTYKYNFYSEIGYDKNYAAEIMKTKGFYELYKYWRLFDVHSVKRILENRNAVIDFGAGCTVYEDKNQFIEIQNVLKPFPYVILLLPMPDKKRSVEILHARNGYNDEPEGEFDFTDYFINHHCNYDLAKYIVYTEGKLPSQTCEEIISMLGLEHLKTEDKIIGKNIVLKRADFDTWSSLRNKRYPSGYAEWDPCMPGSTPEKDRDFWRDSVDSGLFLIYGIYSKSENADSMPFGFINSFDRKIPGRKGNDMFELLYMGGTCETGIHIFEETERRKGYASEAYSLFHSLLAEKFKMEKIKANIYEGNTAAQSLYKKLGYNYTDSYTDNGSNYLTFEYDLTKTEL